MTARPHVVAESVWRNMRTKLSFIHPAGYRGVDKAERAVAGVPVNAVNLLQQVLPLFYIQGVLLMSWRQYQARAGELEVTIGLA